MKLEQLQSKIPPKVYEKLKERKFNELLPCQVKSIQQGLFRDKNLLVCTPTGSGKTLVAELGIINALFHDIGKAIYIVPLKSLASEKFKEFKQRYPTIKIALSIGDIDSSDNYLKDYDLILCTSEKLDSLIRHQTPWLKDIKVVIVDEIHLLHDPERGPTLEILITLLRHLLKNIQIIGLSATIGNPKELAAWLNAELVIDTWRPVRLDQGVYIDGQIQFIN